MANYEEAFLSYIDGELSAEGMAAVEAFVLLHPDLQQELDILLSTKLDSEVVVCYEKESLLADNMKVTITDEDLLLYIDNELSREQKSKVESRLAADIQYNYEHQLLLSAKLAADQNIVYPNKADLYRHTQKRIKPKIWMRIAAAAILLLSIGILWTSVKGIKDETGPYMVQAPTKTIQQPATPIAKTQPLQTALLHIALQTQQQKTTEEKRVINGKEEVPIKFALPAPDQRDRLIALHEPAAENLTGQNSDAAEQSVVQQQTINNPSVTTGTETTYTTIDDAATTETGFSPAVAISSSDDKRGSVRGFLRKASRFIERRTGINPVNEDDELVIGVVALKLK